VEPTVALVTGAASGIGRATALAFGRDARIVVCADIDRAGAEATAAQIVAAGGVADAVTVDVADDDSCRTAVEAAVELGRLATLVNIAGILLPDDRIDRLSPELWDRTMAVNVRSVYSMSRHAVAHMKDAGGVIVNTASVHAYATMPASAAYAASKGAVLALTRQLALDLTPLGIRVVAVAPGSVDTPMSRQSLGGTGATTLAELGFDDDPLAVGRVGAPAEIAAAILWLASPAASFVNGTCLTVDGALLARLI
jgi:NAD(P)-dependent dehydrogenase (short-subunit alcohol dehydrogenase family)